MAKKLFKKNRSTKLSGTGSVRITNLLNAILPPGPKVDNSGLTLEIKRHLAVGKDEKYILLNVPKSVAYDRYLKAQAAIENYQELTRERLEKAKAERQQDEVHRHEDERLEQERRLQAVERYKDEALRLANGGVIEKGAPYSKQLAGLVNDLLNRGLPVQEIITTVLYSSIFEKYCFQRDAVGKTKKKKKAAVKAEDFQRMEDQYRESRLRREEEERLANKKRINDEACREDIYEELRQIVPAHRLREFRLQLRGTTENVLESARDFMVAGEQKQAQSAPRGEAIEPVAAQLSVKSVVPVTEFPVKPKREGKKAEITTRPNQIEFTETVRLNCFNRCVISGVRIRQRTEATHLVEHCKDGIDHYTNGLLMRVDLHRLFDAGLLAINPETLTVHFDAGVLADDHDLMQFEGKCIAGTQRPINPAYLLTRWAEFNLNAT
ncbi:HNH endonuclease [Serratia sp. CMO1]|uniref:HNH endonuclease signature motif containing protein n=1 Tax=Serratia TaxID=613 RepID=UPI00069DFFAC|nr:MULTISPECIES: HNH endonuclease signature motif containing protein [Serratia]MDI3444914.1 HNH endonuclease signature motif containing protein [Serratia marcescens]QPI30823.1 HNH endonuclease [Serratia sp. CMO1]HEJ6940873.1 HNH endonuclease [Serratia marcescens]